MKNSRRRAIMIIIVIIIILLLVLLGIIFTRQSNKTLEPVEEVEVDYYEEYNSQRASEGITADDAVASLEDSNNRYYTVKSIIDTFNVYVGYLNATIDDLDLFVSDASEEQKVLKEYRQDGIDTIKDMLADNYKNNKSDDVIYNYLKSYSGKEYTINKMYRLEESDFINTYFIYGAYESTEFNFVVILDRYNYTFEIYLNDYFVENKYSLSDIDSMKALNITSITANDNNEFQYNAINDQAIALEYYESFINQMLSNPDSAYEMLDATYKSKRFAGVENFKTYINDVIETSKDERSVSNYKITSYDDYTEYICMDNMGCIFTFKVTGVMEYTVLLDTYTVPIVSYDKEYEEGNDSKKVQLLLNRFFECLNNKDYTTAYSYLNSTFKKNNFADVNTFKNYVEKNWFDCNSYSYSGVTKNTDTNEYTITGTIDDLANQGSYNARQVSLQFIIRPGENLRDFEMSFEIK